MAKGDDGKEDVSKKGGWRRACLAVALGLVLALLLAELVLLLLGFPLKDVAYNQDLVWTFPPWFGDGNIKVNALGFRDGEHELEKPEGVTRPFFLGRIPLR